MAKHKKLEPIRLEDLENNPCASGLEKVLRFEVPVMRDFPTLPAEAPEPPVSTPVESARPESTPAANVVPEITPPVSTRARKAPDVSARVLSTPVESPKAEFTPVIETLPAMSDRIFLSRTKKRLFRPMRPVDAHTDGENRLYQFLWEQGKPHAPGVRVYAGSMTTLARAMGRDDRNTRPVMSALIKKLSVAIAREQDFRTGHPRIYFVYDPAEIMSRRKKAGLDWALKNKGVQLLTEDEARVLAAADQATAPADVDWSSLS